MVIYVAALLQNEEVWLFCRRVQSLNITCPYPPEVLSDPALCPLVNIYSSLYVNSAPLFLSKNLINVFTSIMYLVFFQKLQFPQPDLGIYFRSQFTVKQNTFHALPVPCTCTHTHTPFIIWHMNSPYHWNNFFKFMPLKHTILRSFIKTLLNWDHSKYWNSSGVQQWIHHNYLTASSLPLSMQNSVQFCWRKL